MKTQKEIVQYIENRIKSIYAGRRMSQVLGADRKMVERLGSIQNAITRGFDATGWCTSQLDPDNNEPGSAMYVAATDVLNYINS
jgi:hypothetical protein